MPKKGEGLIDATEFYFPAPDAKAKPNSGSVDFGQKHAGGDQSADLTGVPFNSKPKASNESDSFVKGGEPHGKFAGRGDSERFKSSYE